MAQKRRKVKATPEFAVLSQRMELLIPKLNANKMNSKETEELQGLIVKLGKTVTYDIPLRLKLSKLKSIVDKYKLKFKEGCEGNDST